MQSLFEIPEFSCCVYVQDRNVYDKATARQLIF